ncbi:MAG TPA: esterase [Firmicutes bacterium]|nr:esterase [Bacillota bacterium]HBE07266.1 esterase [Bacillota bacterium]HCF89497.1 esterase [Bacillota bacterium]
MEKKSVGLGLALGGGAARGMAHLGVLRVLEREGINVDYLAGTSMGAVVAAVYAVGTDPNYIARLAEKLRWETLVDIRFNKMGLISGDKIERVIQVLTKNRNFEELQMPLAIIAADLGSGEPVIFRSGPIYSAVRASIAIPGVFEPIKCGDRMLVDGGIINNVPVKPVRDLGADVVIAVDVSHDQGSSEPRNFVEVLFKAFEVMGAYINKAQLESADLVIAPNTDKIGPAGFYRAAECIAAGEQAAEEALPRIRELLAKKAEEMGCQKTERQKPARQEREA